MSEPTPQQQRAITAPINMHVALEAVPGSGKTFVIERRLDFLVQNGVDPNKILVVTFSKAQAEDMRLRILSTFPYLANTALADGFNGRGQITTIHAACNRMLQEYYPKFRSLNVAESWRERSIIEEYVERINWTYINNFTGKKELVGYKSILYWINAAKGDFIPWTYDPLFAFFRGHLDEEWCDPLARTAVHYQSELHRHSRWAFADMLYEAERAFTYDEDFRAYWHERFSHLLVDEAQDTSAQAMRIIEQMNPQAVFITGDADQTLYRWQNAAPEFNLRGGFDRIFRGQRFSMTTNFRSHPALLKRAEKLILYNYDETTSQYAKSLEAREDSLPGPDISWKWYNDPDEEAYEVVAEIASEVETGETGPGSYFIMGRINAQMAYFELELLRKKIPFVNLGYTSFFNRRIPKIIIEYMRLATDPYAWEAYDYIYNIASCHMKARGGRYSQTRWLGKEFNERLSRTMPVRDQLEAHRLDENRRGWTQWARGVEDLLNLLDLFQEFGPQHNALRFVRLLRQEVLDSWIEAEYTTEEDMLNGEVESVWDDLAVIEAIARNLTIAEFFTYIDQLQVGQNVKPEELTEYVLIGTIYRFKGLERPRTYVVGVCENILPHRFSLGVTPPTDGVPVQSKTTVLDERNVMYVAITRASERCCISGVSYWPGRKERMEPSRFIDEMELEV